MPASAPAVTAQAAAGAPEPAPAADAPATPAPAADGDKKADDIAPEFELVTVTYRGKTWNIPKDRGQWDMNVQFEFEEGRRMRGFFVLLGGSPENVAKTRDVVYSICRTNTEVDDFMDHLTEVLNKECTG